MTSQKNTRTPQAKSADLLVAMTGKASPAKAVEGDEPVFAYIESLPEPQKSIAKHLECLGRQGTPGPQTRGEMGNGLLGQGRRNRQKYTLSRL